MESNSNQILFEKEAESKLFSGIEKVSKAVGSTLGPRGRTVIIESRSHTRGLTVTKDGVTVARSVFLYDPTEDLAVRLIIEAAKKTAEEAGDGTTTSIVVAHAILKATRKYTDKRSNMNEIIKQVKRLTSMADNDLVSHNIPITNERMEMVASISANNDRELGKIISKAYIEAGEDGSVMVDKSPNHKTYFETYSGMRLKRGLISPYSVTDFRRKVCELDNPLVLLSTVELPTFYSIQGVMSEVMKSRRPLLIIGNLSHESLKTFNSNLADGSIRGCHILPPSFGDQTNDFMSDMAITFGARFIDKNQGDNWDTFKFSDLGEVKRVSVSRTSTLISMNDSEEVKQRVSKRVEELKAQIEVEDDQNEIEFLRERISRLSGMASIIYVGANSDIEQKEKKDRVDDAVLATKAAIEEGILPGGGISMFNAAVRLKPKLNLIQRLKLRFSPSSLPPLLIARLIVSESLSEPLRQIIRNSGLRESEIDNIVDSVERSTIGHGYDAKQEVICNMVLCGIIDPTKVTRKSIQNATSVATTIMNTSAIITNISNE